MKEEIDKRWRDLGEFIREQRNLGQMSLRKLSEVAGVSNPYLSQIERGLRKPSAEILQQIARALEISSETLYVRAGILDEPGQAVDPLQEIRRDPTLTEDQKKTLVRIYESFRRENEYHPDAVVTPVDTARPGREDTARPGREDAGRPGREDAARPGRQDTARPGRDDTAPDGGVPEVVTSAASASGADSPGAA